MNILDLENYDLKIHNSSNEDNLISVVNQSEFDYSKFYSNFIYNNRPCIVKSVTNHWKCQKEWVRNGKPDIDFLNSNYGETIVPVADCHVGYYNSHLKINMNLCEYLTYWVDYMADNSEYKKDLYLKDWHFMKEFPDERIYEIPLFFASDWLNEYLINKSPSSDDYRFVYMGPKGTWTPLHIDVFSSFSWSVNICGKKKWAFFPPGRDFYLRDNFGTMINSLDNPKINDRTTYPNNKHSIQPEIIIQEVGDAIFVPSGWAHQVWNLENTISLNHNWINGSNINIMWEGIKTTLNEVTKEISDCQDMENWADQVQVILKSLYGMDIVDFISFLTYILERRLEDLKKGIQTTVPLLHNYSFGTNHIIFDVLSCKPVIKDILKMDLDCILKYSDRMSHLLEAACAII